MSDPTSDPLALYSDRLAALVETAARCVVAVHGGGRRSTSAIHWRPGILVTAEEALEREDDIAVTLPDGQRLAASLVGRDPSEGGPIASHGVAGFVGGAWQSQRGGTIDHLLRLDLNLSPAAEGGALVDTAGRVLGMTVLGPRRRALAIPASTVDRAVDQLLAKGHVARGYLGAGLQRVRVGGDAGERGVLVVAIDPGGPAARAGLLVGDVITRWNGAAVTRVREIMRLLSTDSVDTAVELGLVRGGQPLTLGITIGERPLR